jgi:hypothetical protein
VARPLFVELAAMFHRKMGAELNARKIPTPAGGQWHAVTVTAAACSSLIGRLHCCDPITGRLKPPKRVLNGSGNVSVEFGVVSMAF